MVWNKETKSLDLDGIARALAQSNLDSISFYVDYVESHFEKDLKNINNEFDKLIEQRKLYLENDEDEIFLENNEYFIDELSYQSSTIKDNYIKNYRSSVVFQLFSFLELELKSFCNRYKKEYYFGVEDLKGSSILENFKLFIKRTNIRNFNELNPELNYIDDFRILRNYFTHKDGIIKTTDEKDFKRLMRFSKDRFNLKSIGFQKEVIDDIYIESKIEIFYIVLDNKNFTKNSIEVIESFLDKLYKSNRRHL